MNNNPSMTSAWKRATATFSQIFFNVSAVASIRFLPVHPHRHWKERMHFHIWGLRAWPFFDGKLPGMVSWGPSRIHLRDPCGSWLSPCSSGFWCDKSCLGCDCIVAREGHIFWLRHCYKDHRNDRTQAWKWRYHPTPPHPTPHQTIGCGCVPLQLKIIERSIEIMWKCQWRS